MMRIIGFPVILVLLAASVSRGQIPDSTRDDSLSEIEFNILSLVTPADTLTVKDSVQLTLGMYLDCTNRITRFEQRIDTADGNRIAVVSVFGTAYLGPRRPLCPAKLERKDFLIHLPLPGDWSIRVNEPRKGGGRGHLQGIVVVR